MSSLVQWDGATSIILLNPGTLNLAVLNDPSGGPPSLYVDGPFTSIGGVNANHVARWDGQAWYAADAGVGAATTMTSLDVLDPDGAGPGLFAAGSTQTGPSFMMSWNGASWSVLPAAFGGNPFDNAVSFTLAFNDGTPSVFALGFFTIAGNNYATNIARTIGPLDLTGTSTIWAPVGQSLNNSVHALAGVPTPSGSLAAGLYAAGAFYTAGSSLAVGIARWDGTMWSALGTSANDQVDALAIASISGPTSLYAGGKFTFAGGVNSPHIARWNGTAWSALGAGLNDRVESLTPFNTSLIAGGAFTASGTTALSRIARWDGAAWSPLTSGTNGDVQSLTVFNDGASTSLYIGGSFTSAGGIPAAHIAKWNGSSWSALGAGLDGPVLALTSYDDGSGSALYAAGNFTHSGSTPISNIAKWNSSSGGWLPLGAGLNADADSLTVFDPDGSGAARPRLLVGGQFTQAGGQPANHAAQWDGATWSQLGTGVDDGAVLAMITLDMDGTGPNLPSLFLGGDFFNVGGASSPHIAQYLACGCYPNCDQSTTPPILNVNDFQCFLNRFATGDPYANCDHSTAPPTLNVNDFQCFVNAFAAGCS